MNLTDEDRAAVVQRAEWAGLSHFPYVFGQAGPGGMDCSGLSLYAWSPQRELPHRASDQAVLLDAVPVSLKAWQAMAPGDLVFYQGSGGQHVSTVGHVAVFLRVLRGLRVVAQATDDAQGTEVIRSAKYEAPLFLGYVR